MHINSIRTPANDGDVLTYSTRAEADAERRFYAGEGHETTDVHPARDGDGYSFAVRDLWNAETGTDWRAGWERAGGLTMTTPTPTPVPVVMERFCYCGICPTHVSYNSSTDQAVRDRRCRGACGVALEEFDD